ncbi:hypothetical protein AB8A20_15530 [Tardiphaga sp. 604_B6_N1_1]|uniref:hypothetical protein n=1 Tax=Tardiphaga sp. 604_B6_N1_1 TaxID=3240779 RepID=UPI003F26C547
MAVRHAVILVAVLLILVIQPAGAFDWDYKDAQFDLTAPAVMGDAAAFESWRKEPLGYLKARFEASVKSDPMMQDSKEFSRRDGYTLMIISFIFPRLTVDGDDLLYEALIAKPDQPRPAPTIIAINGHGEVGGEGHGQAPITMFNEGAQGDVLAKAGYTIVAFPNTIHALLAHLAKETDYSIIWARLADKALDKIIPSLPTTRGFVALGNAAGGLTSLVLTIMRADIMALASNGAFFSLEHTRREYRIPSHPFCHDFRAFFSYTPLYALAAPKPLLLEMGQRDGLWLGAGPATPLSWFSGTKRSAISDETLGSFLQLKEIWRKLNAPISLFLHTNGHEDLDVAAAIRFIDALPAAAK